MDLDVPLSQDDAHGGRPVGGRQGDDDALDAFCDPICDAEKAILAARGVTLIDIERKLAVISNWDGENEIEADMIDGILADVREINQTPVAEGVP